MALKHIGGELFNIKVAPGVEVTRSGHKKFVYSTDPKARVKNPDWRICEILLGLNGRFGKSYSFPSQDKICDLVRRFVGRSMSRRTLNRHLLALQRDGFLRRQRRITLDPHRGRVIHSTLYTIGGRYFKRIRHQVEGFARQLHATVRGLSAIRVPNPALYAETLLKILMPPRRKRHLSTGFKPAPA